MTYIQLTDDMRLTITKADTIHRGDNLSKKITFLLPQTANEIDVHTATVFLVYLRADGTPDVAILEPSSTMYNSQYYQYVLPVTCKLSRYPGEVRMWLELFSGDSDNPKTAKTDECKLHIRNSENLDDCLGNHQLTALYQLKKKVDSITGDTNDPDDPSGSDDTDGSDNSGSDTSTDGEGFPVVEF